MKENKLRLLVFHQALAPYRRDSWNALARDFQGEFYFIFENVVEQNFDQEKMKKLVVFAPKHMKYGLQIGTRAFKAGFFPIIKTFRPDIVFTYEYSQTTLSVLLLKKLFGFKYQIYTVCDDSMHLATSRQGFRETVRKFLINKIDGLIVLNREVGNWYNSHYKLKLPPVFFPIVANDDLFRNALTKAISLTNRYIDEYRLEHKKVIMYVGRLVEVKGLERLVEAFSLISANNSDTHLVLVGQGPKLQELQDLCKKYQIERQVHFTGFFEGHDLMGWYNLGQVFVLPSHSEAFGAVVNEALLAGQYVLCSSRAGASEIIRKNSNGDIFDPYDITNLASLMQEYVHKCAPVVKIDSIRASLMPHSFIEYYEDFRDTLIRNHKKAK
jgi:glycosyltransferase involved in cell wall biosynthesis